MSRKNKKNKKSKQKQNEIPKDTENDKVPEPEDAVPAAAVNDKTCDLCDYEYDSAAVCNKCDAVSLCEDCVKRHEYNGKRLPWSVSRTSGAEVSLTATRIIKPLEVVIEDTAVVTIPGTSPCNV